jgi:biopolymer transport protein ExbD
MRFVADRRRNDEERILPLINVVFLLLIFFILTGRIVADDPFDIAPPLSSSAGEVEAQDLLVLVGADGRLALDGQVLDAAGLKAAVSERLRVAADTPVWLKADGRAEAAQVVTIMELLRQVGVARLKLLTVPEVR